MKAYKAIIEMVKEHGKGSPEAIARTVAQIEEYWNHEMSLAISGEYRGKQAEHATLEGPAWWALEQGWSLMETLREEGWWVYPTNNIGRKSITKATRGRKWVIFTYEYGMDMPEFDKVLS